MPFTLARLLVVAGLCCAGVDRAHAQGFTVEQTPSMRTFVADSGAERVRRWLADVGVSLAIVSTQEAFGNVAGGLRRGSILDSKVEAIVGIDFGRLAGVQGLTFFANAFQIDRTGGVRADLVGGLNTVSNIEALPSTRLSELWLEQKFLEGRASVRFGQLAADSEFFNSAYFNYFINSDWPTITAANLPGGGPAYPLSTPGVRLKFDPNEATTFLLALFNGDPAGAGAADPQRFNRNGLNFRVNDPPLLMGEFQLRYNQAADAGLAGGMRVGFWHHFGRFNDQRFDDLGRSLADPFSTGRPRSFRGDDGVYAIFDQQLYRPRGGDPSSGITAFARISATPSDRNINDFYLDGGMIFSGLFPNRPQDSFGATFIYAHISDAARAFDRDMVAFTGVRRPLRDYEFALEFSYSATLAPGWLLQPTLKFVFHPGGNISDPSAADPASPIRNATVVGVRSTLRY